MVTATPAARGTLQKQKNWNSYKTMIGIMGNWLGWTEWLNLKFGNTLFFLVAERQDICSLSHNTCQDHLIIEASRSYSDTPLLVGLLWTSDKPNAETSTWQHTTHIHAHGGIWTHNPSKRTAADLRLRPRGHCDRPVITVLGYNNSFKVVYKLNKICFKINENNKVPV